MTEALDPRRKRLLFRSWHRGMREADLLLGPFADHSLAGMTEDQLDRYEALIGSPDQDLFGWISGREAVPVEHDNDIMRLLKEFTFAARTR
jgi:antitoxin CptB